MRPKSLRQNKKKNNKKHCCKKLHQTIALSFMSSKTFIPII